MTFSMRERLLLGAGATLCAAITVTCVIVYLGTRAALVHEFTLRLQSEARALATMIHYESGRVHESMPVTTLDLGVPIRGVIELRTSDGMTIARSPGLAEPLPIAKEVISLELAPDERWMAWTMHFQPVVEVGAQSRHEDDEDEHDRSRRQAEGPFTLRIGNHAGYYQDAVTAQSAVAQQADIPTELALTLALDASTVDHALTNLLLMLIIAAVVTLIGGMVAMALVVQRASRPIRVLASQVAEVCSRGTPAIAPLSLADAPAELTPLIEGLNHLLHRLHNTIEREKSFSADIAHELRTPLTGLRAGIDVCLRRDRDADTYRHALEESRHQCIQLQSMVGTLLELARLDTSAQAAGGPSIAAEIPLRPMVLYAWENFAARAAEQQITFACTISDEVATADPERFERIIANLLENAVTYCNQGGRITVTSAAGGGRVRLRVANSGSRIEATDADKVFDRFWRGDRARTGAGINAGLGLCLCQRLVRLMGGSISATSIPGGEFVIALELHGRKSANEASDHVA